MHVNHCVVGVKRVALCAIMHSMTRRTMFLQRRDHNALPSGSIGTFRHCLSFVGSRVLGVFEPGLVFVLDAEDRFSQSSHRVQKRGH